jgi:hypothetical protein
MQHLSGLIQESETADTSLLTGHIPIGSGAKGKVCTWVLSACQAICLSWLPHLLTIQPFARAVRPIYFPSRAGCFQASEAAMAARVFARVDADERDFNRDVVKRLRSPQ